MVAADVVVVGAGLAGLSTAIELQERGRDVLVIERRDVVGGRTSSWLDDGMPVETGLHRFLGFYAALPDLLRRCGVKLDDILCWEDEAEIRVPGRRPAVLGASPVHKPLTTIGGLAANNHMISPLDKLSLVPFLSAGMAAYAANPRRLDQISVTDFARRYRVTQAAHDHLLVPLTAGIFFVPPERYSAFQFFGLFAPALPRIFATRLGAFTGGMTEVMCEPIAEFIRTEGGTVRTGYSVEHLIVGGDGVSGVRVGSDVIEARHVVIATALGAAQQLINASLPGHKWFEPMLAIPKVSSVTVQFELTEPSMGIDRTTFGPGTSWASFSEQSRTTFQHARGRLSIILTPPERFLDMPDHEILSVVLADGRSLGIDIEPIIERWRVERQPHDFGSLAPGHEHLKPTQLTPVNGLTLAGDWTRQPFLQTMEGAVLSGRRAAIAVTTGIQERTKFGPDVFA